jgi:hypothetical protein
MTDFRKQAEVVKLSRLLHTTPESLAYLEALDTDTLHDLRQSCTRQLLDQQRALFGRIATASKLLPMALLAFISERTMGPLLCARIAGEMSTARAIEICKHLSPAFMASSAIYLEADKARELTAALPLQSVVTVTRELIARKEFITLGDLVGTLPMSIIEAVLREVDNGEALLRIGFFVESTERLNDILDTLPIERLHDLIAAAADEKTDLWPHALALMSVVKPHWQARLVNISADGKEETLVSMIRGVARHDLWSTVLPLMGMMTRSNQQRVINLPVVNDDAVLRRLLQAAETENLWHHLLPLIPLMNEELRGRVAFLTDELSEDTIRHLVSVFHGQNTWHNSLPLIEKMGIVRRAVIAELVAESSDEALESLIQNVSEHKQWHLILPLVSIMTEKAQQRFVRLPLMQDESLQRDVLITADEHGLWQVMLPLVRLMEERERHSVARLAETLDADTILRWTSSIRDPGHWLIALEFMTYMSPKRRNAIAMQTSEQDDALLNHMLQSLNKSGEWQLLISIFKDLPTETQQRFVLRSSSLDPSARVQLLMAIDSDTLDTVIRRISEVDADMAPHFRSVIDLLPEDRRDQMLQRCRDLGVTVLLEA